MIREPVLKDLEGARKTHKIMGVALETRQGVIIGGAFVVYSLICYYLAGLFGLDSTTAAIAFSWLIPIALALAFVKVDGRPLEFWVTRKYLAATRPDVLIHTQLDPDDPTRSLRNSVQRAIPAERFHWEMLGCKDGTYLVVFEIEPVGLSLVGETERGRAFAAAKEFYNRLDFPIVEMVRSKEGSTARYTRRLRQTIHSRIPSHHRKLRNFADRFLAYIDGTVPTYNIYERRSYLILPYNPTTDGAVGGGASAGDDGATPPGRGALGGLAGETRKLFGMKGRPSPKDVRRRQREAEAAYRVLSGRAQVAAEGLIRMGCRTRLLTNVELLSFIKEQTSRYDPDADEAGPNLYSPLTLEHAGYEMLSEEERHRMAHVANELREDAPIAFAMGELSVAEKVAPDAVRIFPEYLRIEDRYHTTLYVSEWADEVYFGMLEAVTHIEGRVKLVKYVNPQPKEKALKILGARLAALRAAERTADDGNVASAQQREISRFTNEVGMRELTSDSQRYLEVCCLIHVEADSEEELAALVEEVRTTLAAYRTTARLCREEAWEAYLSCLPFGKLYLTERFVRRGMLTNPAACLFAFGSQQIDHESGVFVGLDLASAAPITIDNRLLMNPHSVTIGQTGGGKTFVVKCLSTRQRMLGRRIVVVDPESNSHYARVAREVGGAFALIAPGSPHKINPFDLHDDYLNINLLEDVAEDGDEDATEAYERARAAALNGKAEEITRMVSLMLSSDSKKEEGLTGAEASYVERAVYEAYARKGITHDPATHRKEPPTFKDFFQVLAEYAAESTEVSALHEKLYSWHSGGLSTLFDAQTNIDLTNKYLVFQISKVKGRQKAPVMHAVLEFMNGILSNPEEASECYVDEAWSILKDPMAAEFAETMWRSARARNCGMHAISQQPIEFFGSPQGEVILALSATHTIFRHDQRQPAAATAAYYDLSEEETDGLLNLQTGEGYLIVGQTRVPLRVMASEEETALFNTKPGSEQEQQEGAAGTSTATATATVTTSGYWELSEDEPAASSPSAPTLKGRKGPASGGDGRWRPYGSGRPAAPPHWAHPAEPPRRHSAPEVAPLHLEVGDEPTRIYAFAGDGASEAAARVARLFASAVHAEGGYVLAVDAAGRGLFERLADTPGQEALTPDAYLREGRPDLERLGAHIRPASTASEGSASLKVVAPPADGDLNARALIEASRQIFDVCVIACGEGGSLSSYSIDWLKAAERVVACTSTAAAEAALGDAREAERLRGTDGTLLCVSAQSAAGHTHVGPLYEPEARSEVEGRTVYALGERAEGSGGDGCLELAGALAAPPSAQSAGTAPGTGVTETREDQQKLEARDGEGVES